MVNTVSNRNLNIIALLLMTYGISSCQSFSLFSKTTSVPVLTSSSESEKKNETPDWFDVGCVANPVILPPYPDPSDPEGEWQCYYYGNSGGWNGGRRCFLPTGSSGLAISKDGGLSWTKVPGSNDDKSILGPSHDGSGKWDEVQTGVGDVIRVSDDELHMYYFGGDSEELSFGPAKIAGFRMRIGKAKSFDNGRTWEKDDGFLLDYDESEGLFASWPRIVIPDDDADDGDSPWAMYYHCFDGEKWRVYRAESTDRGDSWLRTGLVLEGGESEDEFDFSGIGTRSVIPWKDGLLMIYEGVGKDSVHRLGAAFSNDGKVWSKMNNGEPILEPGEAPLGEWTKQVIGTPFVVKMPDGSLRLFHCAKEGSNDKMSIGMVISKSGEIEPEYWSAL